MGKLEELKLMVAEWFDSADAQDLNTINKLTDIKNLADDALQERDALVAENKSLVGSYKELVKHTSFNDQRNAPTDQIGGSAVSFEDALEQFIKNN